MKEYKLSFTKDPDHFWYIDLPNWPLAHHNLMMVAGADTLCEELKYDENHTSVDVVISDKPEEDFHSYEYIELEKIDSKILGGATYKVTGADTVNELWICPVTLCVFGKYPKYIYLKSNK